MAGYWPSSFLRVYGPRRSRGPETRKKKERGRYPNKVGQLSLYCMAFEEIFLSGHSV